MNLGNLVTRSALFWADRIALKDERIELTYAQLDDRTNRLANALSALGVAKGDRVAVLAWNRVEIAEAEVALLKGGFTRVPINARLSADEVVHVCKDSEVKDQTLNHLEGGATVLCADTWNPNLQAVQQGKIGDPQEREAKSRIINQ